MEFESVDCATFQAALHGTTASPLFGRLREAVDFFSIDEPGDTYVIHRGGIVAKDGFVAPALHVLIEGDLIVDGFLDLDNPEGFDEGGSFIVTGNVACDAFVSHYGKSVLIGGDLEAREILVNDFQDSGLYVAGDLRTHFLVAAEICPSCGGRAVVTYGLGACGPLHVPGGRTTWAYPEHSEAESLAMLALDGDEPDREIALTEMLRAGRWVFRPTLDWPR